MMARHVHPALITDPQIGDSLNFDGTSWVNQPRESFVQASLVGQNGNQADAPYDLTTGLIVIGTRLVSTPTTFTISEPIFYLELSAMATYEYEPADANNSAKQRVSPLLHLVKNGVPVVISGTGYQRHTTGHNDSSNYAHTIDLAPQLGDVWEVRMSQGATQNDVMNVTQGQMTAKAVG